jgi:hypothetical protein
MDEKAIEAIAVKHEAFGFGLVDANGLTTHGFDPDGLAAFVREVAEEAVKQERADAERYRWLRERAKRDGRDGGWYGYYVLPMVAGWDSTPYAHDRGEGYDHASLDDAIDAALRVRSEQGKEER